MNTRQTVVEGSLPLAEAVIDVLYSSDETHRKTSLEAKNIFVYAAYFRMENMIMIRVYLMI